MLELADIFTAYGPAYREQYDEQMLPSHKQAMWDIEHCRTAMMGGQLYWCKPSDAYLYSYHSCGNRHCPKCGGERADMWRDKQLEKLLPVKYFLVTCTLPHTLNPLAHSHQKLLYRLLFTTSADALQTLALNPEWLGAKIGMVGALHTWSRNMGYHLHVHYLVPAGGVDSKTRQWKPAHPRFLVPWDALRTVFRARFRDALKEAAPDLFAQVPPKTWTTKWVVHSKLVGDGKTASASRPPS
ncbi:MAG: transposase zinc-binding domain-containing protein [Desulfobacteraceae bacterium]